MMGVEEAVQEGCQLECDGVLATEATPSGGGVGVGCLGLFGVECGPERHRTVLVGVLVVAALAVLVGLGLGLAGFLLLRLREPVPEPGAHV